MKSLQPAYSVFLLCCLAAPSLAVDFATQASPWQSSFPASSRLTTTDRNASYWVERDPRYTPALPSVARTSYRPIDAYRPNAGFSGREFSPAAGHFDGRRGSCGHGGGVSYAPGSPTPPYYGSPVSNGYYKGDGLFGKDTMFAKDQPVRNFFRYLLP